MPPPGNYLRHPNLYLPAYSIAGETEGEDNDSIVMHQDQNNMAGEVDGDDDDDDSPSSSRSSFASQIHRPSALLRGTVNGAASSGAERVVSVGSCSDISNLCDIEDSEYEVDEIRPMSKPVHAIQTDV